MLALSIIFKTPGQVSACSRLYSAMFSCEMPITAPCRWTPDFEQGHFNVEQPHSATRQSVAVDKIAIFPFLGI